MPGASDIRAGGAYIELSTKGAGSIQRALASVRSQLESVGKVALGLGVRLGALGGAMAYSLRGPIKAAADFEETLSKFEAVFKTQARETGDWAKALSKGIGRSETDTMDFLASFQDIFVPMGFAREEATKLSKVVAQLGYDLASFGNRNDAETMQRILGGLIGNHENLRAFGVSIMESSLNAELMAMGLAKGTKQATEQQKVLARLRILLRGTSDAHGDAARTVDSFTNSVKALVAKFGDLKIAVGTIVNDALRPYVAALANAATNAAALIQAHPDLVLGFLKLTAAVLGTAAALLVVAGAGSMLAFLLTPLGLVAAALIYLSGLFDLLKDSLSIFGDFWRKVWDGIKDYMGAWLDSLYAGFYLILSKIMGILGAIQNKARGIVNAIGQAIDEKLKNAGLIKIEEYRRREEERAKPWGPSLPEKMLGMTFGEAKQAFADMREDKIESAAGKLTTSGDAYRSAVAPIFSGLESIFNPDALRLPELSIPEIGLPTAETPLAAPVPKSGITGFFGSTSGREMGGAGNSLGQRQLSTQQGMLGTLKSMDAKLGNMTARFA